MRQQASEVLGELRARERGEHGAHLNAARYMDSMLGLFISENPKQDGLNWFVHCESNTVNREDTNGGPTLIY